MKCRSFAMASSVIAGWPATTVWLHISAWPSFIREIMAPKLIWATEPPHFLMSSKVHP